MHDHGTALTALIGGSRSSDLQAGTTERVTQPGKIAIVYGPPAEAQEYRGYLEYLRHLGYVAAGVEELELEELQGVHGLRPDGNLN
jgi:hypothetical protein